MYQRLSLAVLCGFLAFGAASAQAPDRASAPISGKNPVKRADLSTNHLKLTGVLVSSSSRSALVNGRPVQEGDHIAGAVVLEIEQRGIRVLAGTREYAINVGSSVAVDASGSRSAGTRALEARNQRRHAAAHRPASRHLEQPGKEASARHPVKAGETLSGIAVRYRTDGITLEQMMIGLFEANPQAFSDNINRLHAGASLRIPRAREIHRQAPAVAAAEVMRHAARWRPADQAPLRVAATTPVGRYGPVQVGDTLSAIASRFLHNGVTLDQMMIALYAANPKAFSNNINVLHQGAILRLPAGHESGQLTPETAAAEVIRQTRAWEKGRQSLSELPDPNNLAAANVAADQAHRIPVLPRSIRDCADELQGTSISSFQSTARTACR